MPRPRFSEMLVTRRRQLGLSISQASQVLRLKEQVLIAFEEGDFDHIPKSGYAQGMLSSYARYLGLNPRQVVNQFSADLNEYSKATQPATPEESDTYLAPRKLLPTSGGPAGDLGAFATTSQPHSRQQSAPLVTRRYVGTLHDEPERAYGYDLEESHYPQNQETTGTNTQYVGSYSSQRTRAASTRVRKRPNTAGGRSGSSLGSDEERYVPGRDLDEGLPEVPIRSNRRASRNQNRNREVPRRRGGVAGTIIEFFSDRNHLIALGGVLGALLLVAVIVFAVRSCSSPKETDSGKTVPVTQSQTTEGTTDTTATTNTTTTDGTATTDATTTDGTATADPNAPATTATSTTQKDATTTAPKETIVVVKVDAGQVSWVEVVCDGESKIASTVTGPWTETYNVHESITIEVGDTAAVVVTENGKQRQFESKTSGIGTLTIQGTPEQKKPEDEQAEKKDEDKDAENEKSEEKHETNVDTGDDEFLYNYDGYDIYYNKENDLYYFFDADGNKFNAADGSPL